jgi:hypothetical protein
MQVDLGEHRKIGGPCSRPFFTDRYPPLSRTPALKHFWTISFVPEVGCPAALLFEHVSILDSDVTEHLEDWQTMVQSRCLGSDRVASDLAPTPDMSLHRTNDAQGQEAPNSSGSARIESRIGYLAVHHQT